jgi:serine/threonine protein phosphatase PrpC
MGYRLFAVCDGHGLNGHMVSNHIKQSLPKHLGRLLKDAENVETQIVKAFTITNRELWNSEIDTNLSGSTTVSLLIAKDIVCDLFNQVL